MSLFDATFRQRCDFLDQTARRSWGNRFLGRRLDKRWAGGSEFVGHSDYTSGDDFRTVDWAICARHDELLTRQYRGSEDRTVYLLLDCSAGMAVGTPSKFDAARRLAAALGYLALTNLDRVCVAAFSDRLVAEYSTGRGRKWIGGLLRFLEGLSVDQAAVNFRSAIEAFVQHRARRGVAVVLSDLFDPAGFEVAIDALARRGFQPYLLQVVDDAEADSPLAGSVTLVDAGRGRSRNTYLEEIDRIHYRQVFREFSDGCRRYCARRSMGIMQTRTSVPFQDSILGMIRTATSRMYAQ